MNKLIIPMAVAMLSVSLASPVLADNGDKGQGFANSENFNACVNAGPGNGGEFVTSVCVESIYAFEQDPDPHAPRFVWSPNNAPPVPPGQE
jgi:hypothetical protein